MTLTPTSSSSTERPSSFCYALPIVRHQLQKANNKPITREDAAQLAKALGAAKYVECSARTQWGLNDVFDEAILAALEPPSIEPPSMNLREQKAQQKRNKDEAAKQRSDKVKADKQRHLEQTLKCTVVGDGGCERQGMLIAYTTGAYPTEYTPTVSPSSTTIVCPPRACAHTCATRHKYTHTQYSHCCQYGSERGHP